MMRRLGKPSFAARKQAGGRGWVINCLVVFGVMVSLGLIGVSAALNFRMGMRSADTLIDGWVYGLGAGFSDGLKALAPFVLLWGWRQRDVLAGLAAVLVFGVCTAYSLTASLGFAAQHRAAREGENVSAIEKHKDLRRQLERVEARLAELGVQRSAAVVNQEIATLLQSRVGRKRYSVAGLSRDCQRDHRLTREACAQVAALRLEAARSEEARGLEDKATEVRGQLDEVKDAGAVKFADPQVAALVRFASVVNWKVKNTDVQFGLALLVALLVEVGSGVGLYAVTTPWRKRSEAMDGGRKGKDRNVKAGTERRLGLVEQYALERLEPSADSEVKLSDMFADYKVWCGWRGEVAFSRKVYGEVFEGLAQELGMRRIQRQRQYVYLDVRLVGR